MYRPDAPGTFPAVLQRTPYDKSAPTTRISTIDPIYAASRGYAAVIQDERGRYSSEGEFYTFVNESDDGHTSIDSVASQSWCSGKVGMCGASYVGATQWLAAMSKPGGAGRHRAHSNGVRLSRGLGHGKEAHSSWGSTCRGLRWRSRRTTSDHLANRLRLPEEGRDKLIDARDAIGKHFGKLPLNEVEHLKNGLAPYYYDWMDHPEFDDYWRGVCVEEHHSDISVPALNFGGWYDIFLGGTIRNYTGMRANGGNEAARRGQRLIIGAVDSRRASDADRRRGGLRAARRGGWLIRTGRIECSGSTITG